jgi:hypothetical protein
VTGTVRVGVPIVLLFLCTCVGFGIGGVAGDTGLSPTLAEPDTDRALNTTTPVPGETVRVSTTVTPESAGPVDIFDEFNPPSGEQASLVSVTVNGTPVSESLLIAYPDSIVTSVSGIDPGETVVFTYDIVIPETASPGDTYNLDGLAQTSGTGDTPVSLGGESQLVVDSPASTFDVSLASVPGSVTVGETVTAVANVSNSGTAGGTQQIGFLVDGDQQTSVPVTLDTGETETVSFEYTVGGSDVPGLNLSVVSANATATETVTVLEQVRFEVALSSVPETATVGETLTAEVVVTNTGDETGTQSVQFGVSGEQVETADVTLAGGANETLTFEYDVEAVDTPELNVSVASANTTTTETVTVIEQASFGLALSSVPESVTVGGTLSVAAVVTNTGGETGTQSVSFAVDSVTESTTEVTVAGGANETVPFEYVVGESDGPELNVSVTSADETASETVSIAEQTRFDVVLSSVPGSVTAGESLSVAATVTNTGDLTGTQSVSFVVEGTTAATTEVTLAGGANETVPFEYDTDESDTPVVNVSVVSANTTATESVPVANPALFEVTLSSVPATVTVGERLNVTAVVTNVGDETGTQSVQFAVGEDTVRSTDLTVETGATETVAFEYLVAESDDPELNVSVATANATATGTVAVTDRAFFEVTLSSVPTTVTVGERLNVTATVTNVGEETGTQSVQFLAAGVPVEDRQLTLAAGEQQTVTAGYTTVETDTPGLNLSVASANETTSTSVTVTGETVFELELASVPQPVAPGNTLTLELLVTNTGEVGGTQPVTFAVDGEQVTERPLTVQGEQSRNVTFEYTVPETDLTELTATVTSVDDVVVTETTLLDPATLEIQSVTVDQSVTAGEMLSLTATVTNTGETAVSESVRLEVDGVTEASKTVELGAGAAETLTFEYTAPDTGQLELAVAGEDVTATETVVVSTPASFVPTLVSVTETVTTGGTVTGRYRIENTGDADATRTVSFRVDGDPVANRTLQLDGGERIAVEFSYTVAAGDPSTLPLAVGTGNDTVSTTVTVTERNETTNRTNTDDASGSGFGPGVSVLAVVCLGVFCLARRLDSVS